VGRATARAHSAVTLYIYLTGLALSRNYTVPGHRDRRRRAARRSRDAANLFSPSLEISDDVRGVVLSLLLGRSCSGRARPRRESREIYQSAHLSRTSREYIFKRSLIYASVYTHTRTGGVARRDENLSLRQKPKVNVPRPPKNTRGEHPPVRVPSTFARFRGEHHLR